MGQDPDLTYAKLILYQIVDGDRKYLLQKVQGNWRFPEVEFDPDTEDPQKAIIRKFGPSVSEKINFDDNFKEVYTIKSEYRGSLIDVEVHTLLAKYTGQLSSKNNSEMRWESFTELLERFSGTAYHKTIQNVQNYFE